MHTIDIFSQITSHKNLVILAFIGAELAGKDRFCPTPFQARNSEPHSRARNNLAPPRFAAYDCFLFLLFYHDRSDALKVFAAQFKYSLVFFISGPYTANFRNFPRSF